MEATPAQALTLKAMFEYWNQLASQGASRNVAFFCDGDGNFRPKCHVSFAATLPELTEQIRQKAVVSDNDGHRVYDFDPVAWLLHE